MQQNNSLPALSSDLGLPRVPLRDKVLAVNNLLHHLEVFRKPHEEKEFLRQAEKGARLQLCTEMLCQRVMHGSP